MRYLLLILTICISLALNSCVHRSPPVPLELTDKEQDCLNYISKDRFLRVLRTDREPDGTLKVLTRQGEIRIYYRIDCISNKNADLSVSECINVLDQHTFFPQPALQSSLEK